MIWRRHSPLFVVVTLDATHNIVADGVAIATADSTTPESAAGAVTRGSDADLFVVVVAAVDRRRRRDGRRATLGLASVS